MKHPPRARAPLFGFLVAAFVFCAAAPPALAHSGHVFLGQEPIYAVAWNAEGTRFAVGTATGNISVYDGTSEGKVLNWTAHNGPINQIAFSPDGTQLVSAAGAYENPNKETNAKIWQLTFSGTPALLHVLSGHRDWITSAVWSPDGKWIATSSGIDDHIHPGQAYGEVYFWDAQSGQLQWNTSTTLALPSYPARIAWSPDGRELATIGHLSDIWLINVTTRQLLQINGTYRDPVGHASHGWSIAWSPDSRLLVAGFSRDLDNDNSTDAGPVVVIDTSDIRGGVALHVRAAVAHYKPAEWVDWDSTGTYFASCSGGDYLDGQGRPGTDGIVDGGEVVIYNNSQSGGTIPALNKFVGGFGFCSSIAWRPGVLAVLAGNADGSARIYVLNEDGDSCWVWEDAAPLDPTTCVAPVVTTNDDLRNLLIFAGIAVGGMGVVVLLIRSRRAEAERFGVDGSNRRRKGKSTNGKRNSRRR